LLRDRATSEEWWLGDIDLAVLIAFDSSTYEVLWAREVLPAEIESVARYSQHVNGHRIPITRGERLGTDVAPRFSAVRSG
jgi:hypothetical protein